MMNNCIGDNSKGADNQQERLINIGWVIGFVDGEGCFSIGLVKQADKHNRKGYKTGYQVHMNLLLLRVRKVLMPFPSFKDFLRLERYISTLAMTIIKRICIDMLFVAEEIYWNA